MIQTIIYPLIHYGDFDHHVNELLAAGWQLSDTHVANTEDGNPCLVAILYRDPPKPCYIIA